MAPNAAMTSNGRPLALEQKLKRAVEAAFARMGVQLLRAVGMPSEPGWIMGPTGSAALNGGSAAPRVWLHAERDHAEAWIWALHELEHIVFWRIDDPTVESACEALMMPWAVAVMKAGGVPGTAYLGSFYTSATALPELWRGERCWREVGDWKRPERSAWYRRALKANIHAGTINEAGLPTWRRPDWSKIVLDEHE